MLNTFLRRLIIKGDAALATKGQKFNFSERVAAALRSTKPKSKRIERQYFIDSKYVRTIGGNGGDGCISFLQLWCNENAGPDGGDGGNGGHVLLEASHEVNNFNHISSILKGQEGDKGQNRDCHGKNAAHTVIKVPIGTIVKNQHGKVVADLDKQDLTFVAAKGGSGGKGNHFFISDRQQAPKISEYGAAGEDLAYQLELRSMAHVGFIGFPNAGKSTLLRAITRAHPKVAPYPFTTLRPNIGMIHYDDYEQVAVADLPGLIPDSHKNKGLGIQFLKHAERCSALLFVVDVSHPEPWQYYETLLFELEQFSPELVTRPKLIVANKIDLPNAEENLKLFKERIDVPIISISAKLGTNLTALLNAIRILYDNHQKQTKSKSIDVI